MKTITVSSFTGFCSRGSEALLRTRIKSIRKLVPKVKFYVLTVYVETCQPIEGVEYLATFGGRREKHHSLKYLAVSVVKAFLWTVNVFLYRWFGFCFHQEVEKIASADIFVSSDGDVLGESYGLLPFIWRTYFLSLGILMKKPVIIYAEGPGPFKTRVGRIIARYLFQRCAYISVRDKLSQNNLVNLGIKKERIKLAADSAFLLEASAKGFNCRQKGKKLIGIAVSKLVVGYGFQGKKNSDPYQVFVKLMSELIDWMIQNLDANIIMVSHAIQPKRDDYQTASDIYRKVKDKKLVKILDESHAAADYKKAISHCDLVIATRLHAAIAALSSGVPVIGIAYSHKLMGIFSSFNVADLIVDVQDLDWRITDKIQQVLNQSEDIKKKLRKNIPLVKKLAEKPASEVAKILNKA